jgi:hypothetical protein
VKKITLKVERKEYDINLKDEIADFIISHLSNDFEDSENLKIKELLIAYVKKSIQLKESEEKLSLLKKEIENV